jgi:hypothetical protein
MLKTTNFHLLLTFDTLLSKTLSIFFQNQRLFLVAT